MPLVSVLRRVVAPIVALALAIALGAWAAAAGGGPAPRSPLAVALDVQPRATIVAGFTDWASIRDGLRLGDAATAADRAALSDDASLRDLTTRSVLGRVIADMHELYGWSAADLEWESYGRSPNGAAMVARFTRSVSIDDVEARLDDLGYVRSGEVWTLSAAGATGVGPELAATLGNVAFVPAQRLVVAADRPAYAISVLATIRGEQRSVLTRRPVMDVARTLAGSDTAVVQTGAFGCRATSFDDADPDVRAQAATAVARAGDLATPTVTGRGLVDGRVSQSIRFSAAFESPALAADQLRVRKALSSGPFIGRSGRIEDTLDLRAATVDGSVATLRFDLAPDAGAYMSGEGPLLFAACP